MSATNSDLVFVDRMGSHCKCSCTPEVFRSVWDRLCRQLFGVMPPEIASEDQMPNVDLWKGGVALVDDSYPYTFTVASDGMDVPKKNDVLEYKGKYYVIGEVTEE